VEGASDGAGGAIRERIGHCRVFGVAHSGNPSTVGCLQKPTASATVGFCEKLTSGR
jgi:hypothetical protein